MILSSIKSPAALVAQVTISVPTSLEKGARMALSGGSTAVIIAILFVLVAVAFWLLIVRKPGRTHRSRGVLVDGPTGSSRKRKRRHRTKTHRVANPTLAQTGGLPPLGAGEQKQPPQ